MIGSLGNCPVCWDDPDVCQCTAEDYRQYYENLEKRKLKQKTDFRNYIHSLLDKSFEDDESWKGNTWEWNFLKSIIKGLDRESWISLKKAADNYFKINNIDWSDGKSSLSPDFGKKWIERG